MNDLGKFEPEHDTALDIYAKDIAEDVMKADGATFYFKLRRGFPATATTLSKFSYEVKFEDYR